MQYEVVGGGWLGRYYSVPHGSAHYDPMARFMRNGIRWRVSLSDDHPDIGWLDIRVHHVTFYSLLKVTNILPTYLDKHDL